MNGPAFGAPSLPSLRLASVSQLREVTDDLLFQDNPARVREATIQLYALLSRVTGLDDDSDDLCDSGDTRLSCGVAISPKSAAQCIIDVARTSKFLRGTHAALLEARKLFPDEPLEILYAGCGPFAALAVPLTTFFAPDEIQLTLLDIHRRSLGSARDVFETFGLSDYVHDYVQCDAACYVHHRAVHVVITETMQRALSKEPQMSITLNLAPQLCQGGILIPEKVSVDACLYDPRKEYVLSSTGCDEQASSRAAAQADRLRINLGRVFELTAEKASELAAIRGRNISSVDACLPTASLSIPYDVADGLELLLATTITVFDCVVLGEYESGLTHPVPLNDFSRTRRGSQVEFLYSLGSNPGFTHRWVTGN